MLVAVNTWTLSFSERWEFEQPESVWQKLEFLASFKRLFLVGGEEQFCHFHPSRWRRWRSSLGCDCRLQQVPSPHVNIYFHFFSFLCLCCRRFPPARPHAVFPHQFGKSLEVNKRKRKKSNMTIKRTNQWRKDELGDGWRSKLPFIYCSLLYGQEMSFCSFWVCVCVCERDRERCRCFNTTHWSLPVQGQLKSGPASSWHTHTQRHTQNKALVGVRVWICLCVCVASKQDVCTNLIRQ